MKYLYLFLCLLLGFGVQAQIKIGDNPQNIDPSSVLELESSSRVLVITRVNTAQMNAIVPSAGALVYNTDIACIHYYTGTEWKDICDAVAGSITFTSEDGTIVITPTGSNNFDIKVGEITGINIVNETVFGADIATATIGERQLAPNSVGSSELQDNTVGKDEIQENAVGTLEIIDGTVQPNDMQPGAFDQLLTTDAAGNVVWLNKNDLGATQADQTTITGAGTTADPIKVADTVIGEIMANTTSINVNTNNIAQNSNDIAANTTALGTKEDLANKSDDTALGNSTTLYPTQNAVKTYVDGQLGTISTDDDITAVTYSGTTLTVTEGTTSFSANLASLEESAAIATVQADVDANETATNAALLLKENLANKDPNVLLGTSNTLYPTQNAVKTYVDNVVGGSAQTIVSGDAGNNISISVNDGGAYYNDGDDDDENEIQTISLTGNNLILSRSGGSVPLPTGADGVVTNISAAGNNLVVVGAGGGFNGNVNLEPLVDNAVSNNGFLTAEVDGSINNEIITASSLTGTTLTITEGGNDFDIDLTGLGGGGSDGVVSLVELNGTDLDFTGAGGGFNGSIDLSTIDTTLDEIAVDAFVANNGYLLAEIDGDVTNETITASSLTGTTLTITEGGVDFDIDLSGLGAGNPAAADVTFAPYLSLISTNTQAAIEELKDELNANIISGGGNPTDELQDLQISGTILTVTNPATVGNQVDLDVVFATDTELAGFNPEWTSIANIPAGFADDVDDTLDEAAVDAFVANNGYLTTEVDGDATNEIQNLSISGSDLSISGGNTVTLPASTADWTTLSNIPAGFADDVDNTLDEAAVDAFVANNGYLTTEVDGDATNEIQNLSISGSDLSISGGNTITLPATAPSIVTAGTNITVAGDGSAATPYLIGTTVVDTDDQTLSIAGDQLSIADGNTVTLPSGSASVVTAGTNITVAGDGSAATPYLIGTTVVDTDDQTLSIAGDQLSIADGNTVTLPSGSASVVTAGTNITVAGDGSAATPYLIGTTVVDTDDQTLSIAGDQLSIADGNTVTLPSGSASVVTAGTNITVAGDGSAATPYLIGTTVVDTDDQTLSIAGDQLSIADGNTVTLPSGSASVVTAGTNITVAGDGSAATPYLIGTTVVDTDDQTLSIAGDQLSIADGNTVTLPSGSASVVTAGTNITVAGDGSAATPYLIGTTVVDTDDQTLSIAGDQLSIADGNTVTLPSGSASVVTAGTNITVAGDGSAATPYLIGTTVVDTDDQTLSIAGDQLSIADGNTVTLPSGSASVVTAGTNITVAGDGSAATPYLIGTTVVDTDDQTLSIAGDQLSIADGNTVTLPSGSASVVTAGTNITVAGNGSAATPYLIGTTVVDTDDQTLSIAGDQLSISEGNTITVPNFANTNLTLSGLRTHQLNGNNLIINGTGSIGIGLSIPTVKLDVIGQIRAFNGFLGATGTAINPGYSFFADLDTGMFYESANQLGFATGGLEAMRIDENQNVGIAIANPSERLHVNGNILATGNINGNVITAQGNLVTVTGSIFKGVTDQHPDYVFQKYYLGNSELKENYDFQTLAEIEAFVKKYHHLPGIKSAEEVKQDGVWDIGASNLQNLEKIEELFLHTIEQEKKINQLKTENEAISTELASLKKDMDEIKALLQNKN